MPANLENSALPTGLEKVRFIPIRKKGNVKKCSNYHTIALISHASKVMLKILQARLQQYVNCELPDIQVVFRKSRGTRDQIANILWIIKEARKFHKNMYICFIDYDKAFDCVEGAAGRGYQQDGSRSWRDLCARPGVPLPVQPCPASVCSCPDCPHRPHCAWFPVRWESC